MSLGTLNIEALPQAFPLGACLKREREMLHFQPFLDMEYIAFRVPSKGTLPPASPRGATIEGDAPFSEPSFDRLSKLPVNETPLQLPQRDPYGKSCPFPEPCCSDLSESPVNKVS
jgi:hypothetical protein